MTLEKIKQEAKSFMISLNQHSGFDILKKFSATVALSLTASLPAFATDHFETFNNIINNKEIVSSLINDGFYDVRKYQKNQIKLNLTDNNYEQIFSQKEGSKNFLVINNPYVPNLENLVFFSSPDEKILNKTSFFIQTGSEEFVRNKVSFIELKREDNDYYFNLPNITPEQKKMLNFFILAHELAHATPQQSVDSKYYLKPVFNKVSDFLESNADVASYLYTTNMLNLNQDKKDDLFARILDVRTSQYGTKNLEEPFYNEVLNHQNIVRGTFKDHNTIKTLLIMKTLEKNYSDIFRSIRKEDYLLFSNAIMKIDNEYSEIELNKSIINSIGIVTQEEVNAFFTKSFEKGEFKNISLDLSPKEMFMKKIYFMAKDKEYIPNSMVQNIQKGNVTSHEIKAISELVLHDIESVLSYQADPLRKNLFLLSCIGGKNFNSIILNEKKIEEAFEKNLTTINAINTLKSQLQGVSLDEETAVEISKKMKKLNL